MAGDSPLGTAWGFGKDGFELPEVPRSKLRGSGEKAHELDLLPRANKNGYESKPWYPRDPK